MTEPKDPPAYVTNAQLNERLEKVPTRWEVRFLILAGFIGSQFVPAHDFAQAAIRMVP